MVDRNELLVTGFGKPIGETEAGRYGSLRDKEGLFGLFAQRRGRPHIGDFTWESWTTAVLITRPDRLVGLSPRQDDEPWLLGMPNPKALKAQESSETGTVPFENHLLGVVAGLPTHEQLSHLTPQARQKGWENAHHRARRLECEALTLLPAQWRRLALRFHPQNRPLVLRSMSEFGAPAGELFRLFPQLGLSVYYELRPRVDIEDWGDLSRAERETHSLAEGIHQAARSRGSLKVMAHNAGIPFSVRRLKARACHKAGLSMFSWEPGSGDFGWLSKKVGETLPRGVQRQQKWARLFFGLLEEARVDLERIRRVETRDAFCPEFFQWVLTHQDEFPDGPDTAQALLSDLWDWAAAEQGEERGGNGDIRPFSPQMNFRNATAAMRAWERQSGLKTHSLPDETAFPRPPIPGGEIRGREIIPLPTIGALRAEGAAMAHCVAEYASEVLEGNRYYFSIFGSEEGRLATAEVRLKKEASGAAFRVGQVRGHGNQLVPEEEAIFKTWVSWCKEK